MNVYINPYRTVFANDAVNHIAGQVKRAARKYFAEHPIPEYPATQEGHLFILALADKYDRENAPKLYSLPDDRVVKLEDGKHVWVRTPDGRVYRESPFGGRLYFSFGPTDISANVYDDGTVEEVEYDLYDFSTKGWRWFRTEEEASK